MNAKLSAMSITIGNVTPVMSSEVETWPKNEVLMTNDEGMCEPERTNGKRGHPERIPQGREESKDPGWKVKISLRDSSTSPGMTALITF